MSDDAPASRHAPPPRVGLIGCGQWGRHILRDLLTLGCHCTVADPSPDARALAHHLGAAEIFTSAGVLPQTMDGYVVATPASTHYEVITRLLDRGRPIYVEKPLTDSAKSAARLAAAMPSRLFVMEKWRYHGAVQTMAELVRTGTFGKLRTIYCRRVQWGQSQLDVNPIWTLLPHDLSIVDHLLGELPTPQWAYAEHKDKGWPLCLHAQLKGGDTTVLIDVSSIVPTKERKLLLSLEKGSLVMDDPLADHLQFKAADSTNDTPITKIPVPTDMPLLLELRAFIQYLRGGPAPMTDGTRAARSVALIEQLIELSEPETTLRNPSTAP